MVDAIERQTLIEQYGDLIEQREQAYRQYCALEIQVMELGQQISAMSDGDYSAMNAEYDRRKRHEIIYSPALP